MFTIETNQLKALLLCAGKKDIRYYLNGVHFESTPSGIIAVSTDGHRLLAINLPHQFESNLNVTIPRELLDQAVKTKSLVIDILIDGDKVTLSSNGQSLNGQAWDASIVYPDFRRVIPNSVTGETGSQFDNESLVNFDKIGKLINGGKASVLQNSGDAALVMFNNDNTIGVLMPMLHDLPAALSRPAWLDITEPLKEVKQYLKPAIKF